ncbi:MAG: TonB C-terminal domain-containing protein [Candidatus Gastranaerophilaceae bacterium]
MHPKSNSLKENRPIYSVEIDVTNEVMPIILKLDKKTTNELNSLSTEFRNENTLQPTKQIKQYNTSLPKNASNIDESVWISYLSSVQKQIKKNWKPKFDKSQSNSDKLTTSVLFEINPKGNIIKKQIIKKSSNQKYDKSVSNAISQINKFAPLPNSFNENLNFVFDFTYVIRDVTKEKDKLF